jgi:two-component system response regulator HydG
MVAINSGPLLHVADLPSPIQNFLSSKRAQAMAAAAAVDAPRMPPGSAVSPAPEKGHGMSILPLFEVERRAILGALEYTKGDRGIAAHLLGIGRTTLYRKLKEYQVA